MAGLGHGHGGLGLLELEADGLGLELGQELALGHAVAFLDVDDGDLAADLGRDVDLVQGLDGGRVGDLLGDPLAPDLEDLDRRRAEGFAPRGRLGGRLLARGGGQDGRGQGGDDELGKCGLLLHGFLR